MHMLHINYVVYNFLPSNPQDPTTIQHKQAASGDLYALSDNLEKRSKNEKSEEVLAGMYSVPDKSKKNQVSSLHTVTLPYIFL